MAYTVCRFCNQEDRGTEYVDGRMLGHHFGLNKKSEEWMTSCPVPGCGSKVAHVCRLAHGTWGECWAGHVERLRG